METARDDADTLRLAGHALSHFRQWERGKVALDRAVRLNPNSAQVLNSAGWGSLHRCEPDPAIDFFHRAIRLSPLDPEMATMLWGLAVADLMNGKNEEALFYRSSTRPFMRAPTTSPFIVPRSWL